MAIFDERYRVVGVEGQCLIIRGIHSGEVLVINTDPGMSLAEDEYPVGTLIALSDPSTAALD